MSGIDTAVAGLPADEAAKYRGADTAASTATASSGSNKITKATGPALEITRGPGMKFSAKLSKRTEFAGSVASYHDNDTGETKTVTANASGITDGVPDDQAKLYRETIQHPDKATATAAATARHKGLKRGSQTAELDLPGMWAATAEQRANLTGFRSEMCGEWVIKKAEFTLSRASGLRTKLSLETPGDNSAGESARAGLLGNDDGTPDEGDDTESDTSEE